MRKGEDYWLWLGPSFEEAPCVAGQVTSLAASRWQRGLIGGLREIGVDVEAIGFVPFRTWPFGPLRVPRSTAADSGCVSVPYVNLRGIRERSLESAFARNARGIIARRGNPKVLISYNASEINAAASRELWLKHAVPWIPIVADVPDSTSEKTSYDRLIASAQGRVFLSRSSFEEGGKGLLFHLDGGVERVPDEVEDVFAANVILYSGALSRYGGVDALISATGLLSNENVELWITGSGASKAQIENVGARDRIRFLGSVGERELARISRSVSVFVNPRPPGLPASRGNFPSKVLEYLSYGKPVVSTWTSGLDEAYRDVLLVARSGEPADIAAAIQTALRMDCRERLELRRRVRQFLLDGRLWVQQARRLRNWVESEVPGERPSAGGL